MKKARCIPITAILFIFSVAPLPAQAFALSFDIDILLLLAGPVSESVQETVLLVRRGDNFVTKDSLIIGCVAAASSGLMVGIAPILGFVEMVPGTMPGATYLVGAMLLSCAMSIAGNAVGMGTMQILQEWHKWRESAWSNLLQLNIIQNVKRH